MNIQPNIFRNCIYFAISLVERRSDSIRSGKTQISSLMKSRVELSGVINFASWDGNLCFVGKFSQSFFSPDFLFNISQLCRFFPEAFLLKQFFVQREIELKLKQQIPHLSINFRLKFFAAIIMKA